MKIVNERDEEVDIKNMEIEEQALAQKYIQENDVVLELGARYGSVSCIINSKLAIKTNQVVVEPDERVWAALEKNRKVNNCDFHIVKGFLSNKKLGLTNLDNWYGGYGTTCVPDDNTKIPSYSMDILNTKFNYTFNVLVADCEGFLETFFDENPTFYDTLRLIIFEADYPEKCNYKKITDTLSVKGFTKLVEGHQNVWIKN
jgi:FkbM family methyltransferase